MEDLTNRLQWRHLRLLHALGDLGQLSAAAQRLAMTQPAASRMLAEIETMVAQPLFTRTPRRMIPTPLAKVLIGHAGSLLRGLGAAANEVAAFDKGLAGSVRIGAVTGAAVAHVVPAIQTLQQEARDARIHVDVGPSDVLMNGLMAGDYDFVLSRIPPEQDVRLLDVMQGRVETVEFLMRAGHPLRDVAAPGLEDLEGLDWVVQAPGTPLRQAVQEAFIARGITLPGQIVNTSSLLVTIAYVQSSDFIAPISTEVAHLIRSSGAGGMETIRTRQSIVIAPYHFIQRKGFAAIPLAARFREILTSTLMGHAVPGAPAAQAVR